MPPLTLKLQPIRAHPRLTHTPNLHTHLHAHLHAHLYTFFAHFAYLCPICLPNLHA